MTDGADRGTVKKGRQTKNRSRVPKGGEREKLRIQKFELP